MFSPCHQCGLFHSKLSCPAKKIKRGNESASPMCTSEANNEIVQEELDHLQHLPFSNIDNMTLSDFFPRSQQLHDHYQKLIKNLEITVAQHEAYGKKKQQERNNLVKNMGALLKEERQSKAECDDVKRQLEILQGKFNQLTFCENKQHTIIGKLQDKLKTLKSKLNKKNHTNKKHAKVLQNLENNLFTLTCDMKTISKEFLDLEKCFHIKNGVHNELLDAYCQLVDFYNRCNGGGCFFEKENNCKRCLGRVQHYLPHCRAYGIKCRKCGKPNHFRFACASNENELDDFSAIRDMILAKAYHLPKEIV